MVEMFVGIIAACMPAATATGRHHLPSYDCLKTRLRSSFSSFSPRGGPAKKSAEKSNTSNSNIQKKNPTLSLESYDLYVLPKSLKGSFKTTVQGEAGRDLDGDGIRLTHEITQSRTSRT